MANKKIQLGILVMVLVFGIAVVGCDPEPESIINNKTPVADDYIFGKMEQTAGSVVAITITKKDGKSPGMVSNIQYAGSIAIPQAIGEYAVTFDVEAAVGWNAATGLYAGNLIIKPIPFVPEYSI
jgi:hypothetical protein